MIGPTRTDRRGKISTSRAVVRVYTHDSVKVRHKSRPSQAIEPRITSGPGTARGQSRPADECPWRGVQPPNILLTSPRNLTYPSLKSEWRPVFGRRVWCVFSLDTSKVMPGTRGVLRTMKDCAKEPAAEVKKAVAAALRKY